MTLYQRLCGAVEITRGERKMGNYKTLEEALDACTAANYLLGKQAFIPTQESEGEPVRRT
jgi:hypothetical protein